MKKRINNIIKFLLVFIICSISSICSYASEVIGEVINPHKLDTSSPRSVEKYEVSKLVEKLFYYDNNPYLYYHFNYWKNNDVDPYLKIVLNMMTYCYTPDTDLFGHNEVPCCIYIGTIDLEEEENKATVYLHWIWTPIKKEENDYLISISQLNHDNPVKVKCKKINGKWAIVDIIGILEEFGYFHKNHLFGFIRKIDKSKRDKIYLYDKPSLNGKIIGEITESFGILLKKSKDNAFFEYLDSLDSGIYVSGLGYNGYEYLIKYDKNNFSHQNHYYIKANDIHILNTIKIKKGFNKELAYFLLGRPKEEKEENGRLTLYYSDKDYIKCDKDNNIISWSGFKEFKDYFEK